VKQALCVIAEPKHVVFYEQIKAGDEIMPNPEYALSQIMQDSQAIAEFVRQKVDSKIRWYQQNRHRYEGRVWSTWQDKVLEIFYKDHLGIEVPRDGHVVFQTGHILIVDWKSPCPILESCKQNGDSTVQVCSTLYHAQYQVLLSLIDPRLLFSRDYSQLRPNADSCREVIVYRPDMEEREANNPCLTFRDDA